MFVANASPLSAFLLHRESWCSVRLRYQFNEHVQADFKQCLQYLSFSLHPFSYPYELAGSALFIIQPISDLSGLSHRLLLVYLKEIVLSDFFFFFFLTHAVIVGHSYTQ